MNEGIKWRRREKGSGVCVYNKWEMFPYDNNKYNSQHMKQNEHNESYKGLELNMR